MPDAVPGVGECDICNEIVPSVKVLDCGHSLCSKCACKIVEDANRRQQHQQKQQQLLCCPQCRAVTECGPKGPAASLMTKYFGTLKCDLCLEKKDSDDCWWCEQCLRTVCSKCSIKEHSKLGHSIAEWNKLEPVKYSINYINRVQLARKESAESEHNRQMVKSFLSALETALFDELARDPELDRLRDDLLKRYGSRFDEFVGKTDESGVPARNNFSSASSPNLQQQISSPTIFQTPTKQTPKPKPGSDESGSSSAAPRRIVAKVLQLAGANNVSETCVPRLSDQKFQIHFTCTPEEAAAEYLRSKIACIPFDDAEEEELGRKDLGQGKTSEEEAPGCKWRRPITVIASSPSLRGDGNNSSVIRRSYDIPTNRIREDDSYSVIGDRSITTTTTNDRSSSSSVMVEEIFLPPPTVRCPPSRIVEIDYDGIDLLAILHEGAKYER